MPNFFRNLTLVIILFMGGWLGMRMAVPPGHASPLWPPAGIALTALLIWGRQLWPGVLVGAIANQLLASSEYTEHITPVMLCSSFLIACASTLQALVATVLISKWLQPGLPKLDTPTSILIFFVVSGPLSCLIASTIGISTLLLFDLMPLASAVLSWRNWWIGDSLGVLIITPLSFCLFGKPSELWRPRRLTVALPLFGTLLALVAIFTTVFRVEQSRVQMVFDNEANSLGMHFVDYADKIIDTAFVLQDFYKASTEVQRNEFAIFSQSLLARHPEIQALAWLPRVPYDALSVFEKTVQAEGYLNFSVTERDEKGNLVPVQKREEYFPILFVEPMPGNEKIFGYDSNSNPVSHQSKQLARESHQPSASQRLKLIQRSDLEPAVLISIPILKEHTETNQNGFFGFVSEVVLPSRMAEIAFIASEINHLGIDLIDLNSPSNQGVLYSKPAKSQLGENYRLKSWQYDFKFVDRTWRIRITPDSNFIIEHGSTLPWVTLIGGLFFTSLLSLLLLTISGRTAQIEALVDHRAQELAKTNTELEASEKMARASESKLRTLIESQPECIKTLARDGTLLEMNRAGLEIIEANSLEQVKGHKISYVVLPHYRKAFEKLTELVFSGESGTLEFEIIGLKGTHRWLDTHAVPLRNNEGDIIALLGLTRDITKRKQAEERLKLAARVFSEAHEGILITDPQGIFIDVNPTFCEITGYSSEEIIGKNTSLLKSGRHSSEFYRDLWNTLIQDKHWQGEVWNRKKNGELYAELLTISALLDNQGVVINYIGLFSDITQSKLQIQMLESLAHNDPLTQLPNRVTFADRLTQSIARSKRDKSLLAICFLDLDGFKQVNDQFGHDIGDQVLIEVASRIKNCIREQDTVSRHGGDEFALLLDDMTSFQECEQALRRIQQAIAEPYLINGETISIGASIGLTLYPQDDADADTLLRHADHAMYQAKVEGKNRYYLFDASQDLQIIDHHKQLHEIELAFQADQFCLYYQPKVNIKTGQVVGVEALIRWLHPEKGMISPLDFLPIIASSELEIRIGNWVIEQAWQQLVSWHHQGIQLQVSVNISSYHLLWPGFFNHLDTVLLSEPLIESRYLQLEILESTALDDLRNISHIVKTSREGLGISIALDDFGTGYSSLTHLRHLFVDTIKIDQSFVRDMLEDPDDYAIVESVISLSHTFRRKVVAEGVESEQQGIVLLLMGCYLLQGYSIARPMPATEINDWVMNYRLFDQWRFYADADLTKEQAMIAIRHIDNQQWLLSIKNCLYPESDKTANWPIMEPGKSHLGRWLKQARQNRQHSESWLEQVEYCHLERHKMAKNIKQQFIEGQINAAQLEFTQLEAIVQQLDELFEVP
jgi:diguanylate cyclase (GGDEF)-like protein/PAS domain S-box-containing protein